MAVGVVALRAFVDAFALFLWRRLAFLAFFRRTPVSNVRMNEITINVRFSADLVVPLRLAREVTVKNLKERLAEHLSLPVEEIRVIFAGKELFDQVSIKEYNMDEETTVHAVRSAGPDEAVVVGAEVCCPLGEGIITSQLSQEEHLARQTEAEKALFFVYCKRPCERVQPGKLRVCCAACGEGSFILEKEPSCWADVLSVGPLLGRCQACRRVQPARFFFKCTGTQGSPHGDQPPIVLPLIRYNFLKVPCLACLETSRVVLVFKCAHVICLDCFRAYCRSRLDERGFVLDEALGSTLPCPLNCSNSLIEESHHFCLLGPDQYLRYQRFAAEEWVLKAGGVLCPRPGCGQGLLPEQDCNRVTCDLGCGFVFCRRCLQGHHLGPCSAREEQQSGPAFGLAPFGAQSSSWEEASRLTVLSTTKPCPKCQTPTERSGGCMHMVCSRSQCGFQWCWLCQDEWSRQCMGAHWFG
ncbi:E3 ubiquitin-protein ligase parkin-like isoform X1 [Haemaphysalis longicornis]